MCTNFITRYMSGATLLAADFSVEEAIQIAFARSHFHSNTYWIVTVGVPKQLKNQHRLALKLISNPAFDQKKVDTLISSFLFA